MAIGLITAMATDGLITAMGTDGPITATATDGPIMVMDMAVVGGTKTGTGLGTVLRGAESGAAKFIGSVAAIRAGSPRELHRWLDYMPLRIPPMSFDTHIQNERCSNFKMLRAQLPANCRRSYRAPGHPHLALNS